MLAALRLPQDPDDDELLELVPPTAHAVNSTPAAPTADSRRPNRPILSFMTDSVLLAVPAAIIGGYYQTHSEMVNVMPADQPMLAILISLSGGGT
jgi:hypothetical protein